LMMVSVFFAVAAVGFAANCSDTGAQCHATTDCCQAAATSPGPDHCEAVNQYYSKCVTQPTCALDDQQCKGKGDTVMEETSCCTKGFVCKATNEWYSKCVNASAPTPPPPPSPGPQPTCADDDGQCDGPGFKTLGCCKNESQCEVVNQFFSKCVDQPKCVGDNALCGGKGDHVMKDTACCDADDTCVTWGEDWKVCRVKGHETCSVHGEQCFGTGGSAMPLKDCCDPSDTCMVVNKYYSKCDSKKTAAVEEAPAADSCPGLKQCPTESGAVE